MTWPNPLAQGRAAGGPLLNANQVQPLNNFAATADPTTADDSTRGYTIGSRWVNLTSDEGFELVDPAVGAAVWKSTTAGGGGGGTGIQRGLTWNFDGASQVDADPGAGKFRANNATPSSATQLFVDPLAANGLSFDPLLSTQQAPGFLYLEQQDDPTRFVLFDITALTVLGSGYLKLQVSIDEGVPGAEIQDGKDISFAFLVSPHPELHTIASHSDTTATGAELETLTDGSNADGLHAHAPPAHSATTGQTANDHHPQAHTIVSHSDTTATGAELNTLTDGSNADGLHAHAANVVQTGTPANNFITGATGGAGSSGDGSGVKGGAGGVAAGAGASGSGGASVLDGGAGANSSTTAGSTPGEGGASEVTGGIGGNAVGSSGTAGAAGGPATLLSGDGGDGQTGGGTAGQVGVVGGDGGDTDTSGNAGAGGLVTGAGGKGGSNSGASGSGGSGGAADLSGGAGGTSANGAGGVGGTTNHFSGDGADSQGGTSTAGAGGDARHLGGGGGIGGGSSPGGVGGKQLAKGGGGGSGGGGGGNGGVGGESETEAGRGGSSGAAGTDAGAGGVTNSRGGVGGDVGTGTGTGGIGGLWTGGGGSGGASSTTAGSNPNAGGPGVFRGGAGGVGLSGSGSDGGAGGDATIRGGAGGGGDSTPGADGDVVIGDQDTTAINSGNVTDKPKFTHLGGLLTPIKDLGAFTDTQTATADLADSNNFKLSIADAVTLAFANVSDGQTGKIHVIHDGASATLAKGANVTFPGGTLTLSAGSADIDVLCYLVEGTNIRVWVEALDFS